MQEVTGQVPNLKDRFELTPEQFTAWAEHLDPSDLAEFYMIYGGDDISLRFVCAIDFLTIQKVQFIHPEDMFVAAYWMAALPFAPELKMESPGTKNRAIRCWKSDAVQAMYERVRYRSVRQGSIRLQNRLFDIGTFLADEAIKSNDIETNVKAADTLVKIVKLVDQQEATIRAERTKRGLQSAREALERTTEMSEREFSVLMKAAVHQLGEEKFKALVAGVEPK